MSCSELHEKPYSYMQTEKTKMEKCRDGERPTVHRWREPKPTFRYKVTVQQTAVRVDVAV